MRTATAWVGALLVLGACGCGERGDPPPAGAPAATAASLAPAPAEPLAARLQGAERVVVATVERVRAGFGRTEAGDELILSTVTLRVEETLRGDAASTLELTLEGGTVGDLTLAVSDLPTLAPGQRGVFALRHGRAGAGLLPHRRGAGILLLDARGERSAAGTLDEVRRAVEAWP